MKRLEPQKISWDFIGEDDETIHLFYENEEFEVGSLIELEELISHLSRIRKEAGRVSNG